MTSTPTTYGLGLAQLADADEWKRLPSIAADLEAIGADDLWFTDHLLWHRPAPDPFAAMAIAAVSTTRIGLGVMVAQLPLRSTAGIAKSTSFVDHLADGRVVVGVGIGEHEAEYRAAGVGDRFRHRGRLLDEGITLLRDLWSGAGPAADVGLTMAPVRQLPIWVGGRSDAALDRATTVADGWIPHLCTLDWFTERVVRLHDGVAAAGRPAGSCTPAVALLVSVDGVEPEVDPLEWAGALWQMPPRVFRHVLVRGTAVEVAAQLGAFADAGAEHVALIVAGDRPVEHFAALADLLPR